MLEAGKGVCWVRRRKKKALRRNERIRGRNVRACRAVRAEDMGQYAVSFQRQWGEGRAQMLKGHGTKSQ